MTSSDLSPDHQQYGSNTSTDSKEGLRGVIDRAEDRIKEAGHEAMSTIDGKRNSAADSLGGMASQLHSGADKAADLGHKGGEKVSNFAHAAGDKVQAGADYLREHDFKEMMQSVEGFVRRHPGQALVAAGVVGFLAARVVRND